MFGNVSNMRWFLRFKFQAQYVTKRARIQRKGRKTFHGLSSTLTLELARFQPDLVCSKNIFVVIKVFCTVACFSLPLYHFIFYFEFDVISANSRRPSERKARQGKTSLSLLANTWAGFFHSCLTCLFICRRGLTTPFFSCVGWDFFINYRILFVQEKPHRVFRSNTQTKYSISGENF